MTKAHRITSSGSATAPEMPPPGWERETPKYRVIRETLPSPKERHRFERPFASMGDASVWQYGERIHKPGEVVETREWPHPAFMPLNYSARKVYDFFVNREKSRMPRSPFFGNELRLNDGFSGPTQISVVPPQLKPMDVRPVRFGA
jgi:hypothetical protein